MTRTPTSKLPRTGTSIFAIMSRLAAETGAINLSQGYPSFDPPQELTDRITWHLEHGANQYAPMPGVPGLLQVIADKTRRFQGRTLDVEREITVSTGATEGLFSAITAMVHRGDEVIVLDPAYDSYEPAIALAGGIPRHVPMLVDEDGEFHPDWQRIGDTINARTRLIVINFPHNPTGAILSGADLDTLADLVRDTDCYILADEVYEHIVFENEPHRSLVSHDELWERSLVISSFGKTVHATGWKLGYCAAPPALTTEFRKIHQFTTFAVSTPMQCGVADFLRDHMDWCANLPAFYEAKRDRFCELLDGSRFRFRPARSTFFQLLDYGAISDEADASVAERWTRDIGVASIPLTVFCNTPFTGTRLRFCFGKDDATLEEAARRLREL
ncbi:MAG: aminotransferase class I/II-fold pyridoxal phosphate-dependent enzyme [Gammaproteobacteria bacterium]|nr:aminotransferase class I/II-fold pyridoxal phosphate-dependent enzyme [Gammaproteobacteria bacterium]NNF48703.1 aminotransferase class I/II-fold pyridoxal phosphate-dependent enzyme [Woeseiaceae bacterium]MBT8093666.1 aminotransferase class I/II-fold pyridoxal phosphate-dependent enzyme [Gammaproteobacteria bacterium]MBT8104010.1 aminotransferase class I/II-fold pyridoxal phosphate-dependent enzyme [Gammaproteobacteria bacterium]NNK24025.1 aminotransferase class I/II-fold pyridoxal phosphate